MTLATIPDWALAAAMVGIVGGVLLFALSWYIGSADREEIA